MGGEAGTGIKNSALTLAKAFIKGGYWVHANVEYPSIIRGGNNTLEVRMAPFPVRSLTGQVNLLAALDERTVRMWHHELISGGALLVDRARVTLGPIEKNLKRKKVEIFDIPIHAILEKEQLPRIMLNTIMLGAITAIICYDLKLLEAGLADVYQKKGRAVLDANLRAARAGYTYVLAHHKGKFACQPRRPAKPRMLLEGNEAMLLGALKAGMTSYTGYPMTPTSSLLHFGATLKQRFNVFVYQPEDEIAAVQMAIGAAHVGARAMTASSGGGFSLMVESLGLAAMTETPLVVLLGQRPGPATGLPTRTGQGDLRFALHSGQDEPPRVVLAPGDPAQAFELMFHAFNIAEKYQLLVIVLGDKYLQESFWTSSPLKHAHLRVERGKLLSASHVAALKKSYKRFAVTADGVSPRVLPGTPGLSAIWRVSADEHDQSGLITENRNNRVVMVDKRRRKMQSAYSGYIRRIKPVEVFGDVKAKRAVVSFGSTKGVLMDALDQSVKPLKVVQVACLMPFPVSEVVAALKGVKEIFVVEGNDTGLFEGLLREQTGLKVQRRLRFYDGRPLTLPQVTEFLGAKK
jgi:2-oxoglutarate ferredoxin oxidoreductase subunit alpha